MLEEIIASLKEELDGEDLLTELGAGRIKKTGRRFITRCLSPDHADKHASNFMYREDRHTYRCYSCGVQGDCIDLVKMVKGISFKEAFNWLKEYVGWTGEIDNEKLEAILEKRASIKKPGAQDGNKGIDLPHYFESDFSNAGSDIQAYVEKRCWVTSLLARYGVGYCHRGFFRDRIIFPINYRDGNVGAFAARATWPLAKNEEKYLYPLDTPLGSLIWGVDKPLTGTPIFVEGITDALRLREYGFNAYAVLGNQLGDTKLNLIRSLFQNHDTLIVIPDNDRGGNILIKWFQQLVHDFNIEICLIQKGNDIDEMSKPEIESTLKNSKNLTDYQVEYYLESDKSPVFISEILK